MLASGVTYQQVFIERRLRREGYFVCLVHGFSASIHFSLQRRITASNLSTPPTLSTNPRNWRFTLGTHTNKDEGEDEEKNVYDLPHSPW